MCVDNIFLARKSQTKIKTGLGKCFQVKELYELHYFFGVNVKQFSEADNNWIGQPSYTQQFSRNLDWNTASLQVHSGSRNNSKRIDVTLYKSAVGMLLYLPQVDKTEYSFCC